jgi:hypothetical protein
VKTVTCSCGYVAAGETADELLADVEAHIDAVHSPEPAAPAPTPGVPHHDGGNAMRQLAGPPPLTVVRIDESVRIPQDKEVTP